MLYEKRTVQMTVIVLIRICQVSNDPMEDKLTLFRQQAAIISRKKESTAEKLNDVRVELNTLEEEVKDKKSGEWLQHS